jgi:hypothetical protein
MLRSCFELQQNEHSDHQVVGNATLLAVNLLTGTYGFSEVDATWYKIYSQIEPNPGYSLTEDDVSAYTTDISKLCEAMWETSYIASIPLNYPPHWLTFPTDANGTQVVIGSNYS